MSITGHPVPRSTRRIRSKSGPGSADRRWRAGRGRSIPWTATRIGTRCRSGYPVPRSTRRIRSKSGPGSADRRWRAGRGSVHPLDRDAHRHQMLIGTSCPAIDSPDPEQVRTRLRRPALARRAAVSPFPGPRRASAPDVDHGTSCPAIDSPDPQQVRTRLRRVAGRVHPWTATRICTSAVGRMRGGRVHADDHPRRSTCAGCNARERAAKTRSEAAIFVLLPPHQCVGACSSELSSEPVSFGCATQCRNGVVFPRIFLDRPKLAA